MKKIRQLIPALILAAGLILPASVLTFTVGCATSSQQVSYKTLASVAVTVDKARSAFLERVNAGAVDEATLRQALDASAKFNAAYSAAVLAARTTQAPTPESVAEAATAFLGVVALFITP